MAHVVEVAEEEGLALVEAAGDDVLGVLNREPREVVQVVALPVRVLALPQELLVVGQLDDQRDVEDVLQPLGEVERDHVPEMERL